MRKDQPATIPEAGGAGLAGMAMRGAAGCGGEDRGQGGTLLTLTFGPDESGGLRILIDRFNKENKGEIRVQWREAPALSDEYFDQIRTELQSGSANMDVIAGDVIWPPSSPPLVTSSTSRIGSPPR